MVFFTCNHCGESVKKPAVQKHYDTRCRGAPKSISCMDCLKDFQDNYVEHTKCISELQKYSGKDYVPRESANSGAKKQESWTEVIRAILESTEYNLSDKVRNAFKMLQSFDNVPRKKAKFLNFVSNSVRIPRQTVEEVWNILEKEQEKMKQARQQELEAAKKKTEDAKALQQNSAAKETDDEVATNKKQKKSKATGESDAAGVVQQNGDAEKVKKKKKREANEAQQVENTAVEETPAKKKKKRKTETLENGHTDAESTEIVVVNEEVVAVEPKQKKKKTKVAENGEANVEIPQPNGICNGEVNKKKRKAKILMDVDLTGDAANKPSNISDNAVTETVDETPKKKQKKVEVAATNGETVEEVETKIPKAATAPPSATTQNEFSWDSELARIIGKYPEGVTLEKLKKKIIKKYAAKLGTETLNEKQQKGFEKKLNKKLKNASKEGELIKSYC